MCLAWGRGSGKSWFQRLIWWTLIAKWDGRFRPGASKPGVRIVLLMPTLEQAKKVHAHDLISELEGQWAWLGGALNRTSWRVTFPGGSWIQWVSAERAHLIRGIRCDVISVDECDDVDKGVFDAVVVPWFSEHHSLGIKVLSGTPMRGRYGLLYRTLCRGDGKAERDTGFAYPGHFSSHKSSLDFPEYVNRSVVEAARDGGISPELFNREWMCSFDAGEGLVYSHFREDFHVRDPDPGTVWSEYLMGVDFGWEDPAAIVVFGVAGHGKDVRIHQLDEVVVQHKTDSELADIAIRLASIYPEAKWFADPSRPQTISAIAKEARDRQTMIRFLPADNSIEDGVATVADSLLIRTRPDGTQWSQMYISPHCKHTIREYGLYRRKRDAKNRDRVLDDIEDKNNHAMDSTRYAIHSRFGTTSRTLATGYGHR